MRDTVLWRKQSRIVMMLADALQIDAERALDVFYSTKVYQQLADPKYRLQLMSDDYILEELIEELRNGQMIELCLAIATQAHKGQTDKVGLPVILHPLAVGLMGSTPEEICVGFLHDTIEDTDTTRESLLAAGVSESIADAVTLLTHDKAVPYFDYIRALIASGNQLALAVKRNDLTHNHSRAIKYGFKTQEQKCATALAMIAEAAK